MLFALALIPAIVLLIVVYVNDKKEKEPIKLLVGLFFAGAATIITALIGELIGELVLNIALPSESAIKATILAMLIVGPVEELGKYGALRLITWKNKNFDYSYDGIVYAVFVSMGFAAFENVAYVFSNGLGTALMRMFTSVPGHACFAVFMGYFYSKAKYAQLTKNKSKYALFNALSILLPILLHGLFDAFLMISGAFDDGITSVIYIFLWVGLLTLMFPASIGLVILGSKKDFCIQIIDQKPVVYRPIMAGPWKCSCGNDNDRNFCPNCGEARPVIKPWTCPDCGKVSYWKFCGECGTKKPE